MTLDCAELKPPACPSSRTCWSEFTCLVTADTRRSASPPTWSCGGKAKAFSTPPVLCRACRAVSCRAVPCRAVSCRVVSCRVVCYVSYCVRVRVFDCGHANAHG
jgi:hypothetical protein